MLWWKSLSGGPNGIYNPAVAVGNKLYLFDRTDVHVFNTVSLRWRKLPPVTPGRGQRHHNVPSTIYGHSAVLVEDVIFLWGGLTASPERYCNVLRAFDVDARRWFIPRVFGSVPERRCHHSTCVLGKAMYIHGGYKTGCCLNDLYKLDTSTMIWSLINTRGTKPPASWGHTATIIGTKMFVFGGCVYLGQENYYNTIRVFDAETNHWLNEPSAQLLPEARHYHSAFAYNGELYIFGGNNKDLYNDMWKFNFDTFSWKKVEPKGNGPSHMSIKYCFVVGDRVILLMTTLHILDLNPSLKTLCKLAVIQQGLDQEGLTHDVRWELAAMSSNRKEVEEDEENEEGEEEKK